MSTPVLQTQLPEDMYAARALPGIQPERGPWLRLDEAYGAQMARRIAVLQEQGAAVHYLQDSAIPAAQELLEAVVAMLPGLGFEVTKSVARCPDGRDVALCFEAPLKTLAHLCQNDFVLMEKRGDEHVLSGGILCFPASWRLSEKAGRPLTEIHVPVHDYTDDVARRVQRLFDGVQVDRPLWRFNQLWYEDPELFQPRSAFEPRRAGAGQSRGPFYRTERQTLIRLPKTRAVVFAIHTYVLARADVPDLGV